MKAWWLRLRLSAIEDAIDTVALKERATMQKLLARQARLTIALARAERTKQ